MKIGDRVIIAPNPTFGDNEHIGVEAYIFDQADKYEWAAKGYNIPALVFREPTYQILGVRSDMPMLFLEPVRVQHVEKRSDWHYCNLHARKLASENYNSQLRKHFFKCPVCSVGFWEGSKSKPASQNVRNKRREVFELCKDRGFVEAQQIYKASGLKIEAIGGIGGLNESECDQLRVALSKPKETVIDMGANLYSSNAPSNPFSSFSPMSYGQSINVGDAARDSFIAVAQAYGLPASIFEANPTLNKKQKSTHSENKKVDPIQRQPDRIREIDLD